MDCHQFRIMLESAAGPHGQEAVAHLRGCESCRDVAEDRRLVELLRGLPLREPRPGFEDRVLQAALSKLPEQRQKKPLTWGLAIAASLVLAAFISLQMFIPRGAGIEGMGAIDPAQVFTVIARPMETRMVDVVLDSKHALENATFIVTLDENLMLENRPKMRELRWQTNVQAGGNKLSLPVQLKNSTGGEMTVTLEHGETRQQVKILVQQAASSALPQTSI